MSGIFDQVINYAPPSLLKGTVTYKGTWSAATNTPTLINPPDSTTNGHYYVVSAAGTQFSLAFNIGDWIISNGSAWEKVDNTDAVNSVFGRTGAVVGVSTDYSAVGITNTALGASNPSTVAATTITASSTIAATGAVTGSNLSGTNTGDQTITLTGGVTGSGTGSFAATVVTNANLTGDVTSSGNATTLTNAPVIAKVLTGYTSGAGTVAATDSILQAIQKLNGNDGTNANLTGVITSSGNATSIASQTGTGTKFVVDTSPVLITPNIGIATGTSLAAALNGTLGATTPSTIAATTIVGSGSAIFGNTSTPSTSVGGVQINNPFSVGPSIFSQAAATGNRWIDFMGSSATVCSFNNNSGVFSIAASSSGAEINVAGTQRGLFSSTGAAITGTLSATGLLSFTGFGTNSLDASGTGAQTFRIRNSTAGTGNYSILQFGHSASVDTAGLVSTSTTYTASGAYPQNGTLLYGSQVGGLNLAATDGSGVIRFFAASGTATATINSSGAAITGTLSSTGNISTSAGSITALAGEFQVGSSSKQLYLRTVSGVNRIDSYDNPITATVPLQINASTYTFQVADVTRGTLTSTGLNSCAVGATTPSTGAFSTLSATASGTPATFTKNSDGIIQTLARASVSEWRFNIANSDPFGGQAGSLAIYPGNASVDFIIGRSNGTTANLKITDANGNAAFAGTGTFTGGINSTAIGATTPSTGAFSTLSATGATTSASYVVGTGSVVTSSITTNAANGMVIIGKTGTSTDFYLGQPGTTSSIMQVPTGTVNVVFAGTLSTSSTATFGATSISAIAGVPVSNGAQTTGGGNWVWAAKSTSASSNRGIVVNYSAAAPNDTGNEMLFCYDSSGTRFSVRSNGGIANYSANDVNLSDERVKTDIIGADSYLDKMCAINVVKFKYKDQTHNDYNLGVIAQQVEAVAPEFVDVDGFDSSSTEEIPFKSIYQTDLNYGILKAVQELAEENKSLRKRLAALESK